MKREVTYPEFDKACESMNKMSYKCGAWWPTIEEIQQYIEPKIKTSTDFILWILETAKDPTTDEERESRRYLMDLFYKNVEIVERRNKSAE